MVALAFIVGLTASCKGDNAASARDGGDGGQQPDAAATCTSAVVCDETRVRACRDDRVAEVLEECAPARTCSRGRCTSTACAAAERNLASLVGCSFTTLHLDNVTSDDDLPASVLVTNPGQVAANVTLAQRSAGAWSVIAAAVVPPMRTTRVALPPTHFEGVGFAAQSALRLDSDLPVTAVHVQSDGTTAEPPRSAGATMLLPEHVLGRRYRAASYPQVATTGVVDTMGGRDGAGQLVIVATEPRTSIKVTKSATVELGPAGGAPSPDPQGVFKLTLEEGDYYQIFTSRDGDDLAGTTIDADKPVAVFSGNISTTYGEQAAGISSADLAHEQLLPVSSWSLSYVAAALPPKLGVCDSLFEGGTSSIWKIVADRPSTQVRFQPAKGVTGPFASRTLGAGEAFRLVVPVTVSFTVTASGPIEVTQGMDCEATLSSAVPTDPLLTDHWFAVLPTFDTLAAIVRPVGKAIYLDGARLDDASFESAGGGFEVAQIPLASCPKSDVVCTHHLVGQFGLTMRGQDVLASWALTAPTWIPCSNPDAPSCGQ